MNLDGSALKAEFLGAPNVMRDWGSSPCRSSTDGDAVGAGAGEEDLVVAQVDAVGHARGVEDEDVTVRLAVEGQRVDRELTDPHPFAVVGPDGGRVVERIAVGGELQLD